MTKVILNLGYHKGVCGFFYQLNFLPPFSLRLQGIKLLLSVSTTAHPAAIAVSLHLRYSYVFEPLLQDLLQVLCSTVKKEVH